MVSGETCALSEKQEEVRAVKRLIRWLYAALVALIVFTGVLLIAQGMREKKTVTLIEAPRIERRAPDGPSLPV